MTVSEVNVCEYKDRLQERHAAVFNADAVNGHAD